MKLTVVELKSNSLIFFMDMSPSAGLVWVVQYSVQMTVLYDKKKRHNLDLYLSTGSVINISETVQIM